MTPTNPIDVLFGGMTKLGPGEDAHTLAVLRGLPQREFRFVVDAGCGTGRQTLALARALGTVIHGVDLHAPFLQELRDRALKSGLATLVLTHHMDMRHVARLGSPIDLLWSEGAAYNIGFAEALSTWAPAIREGGFAVVSELSWLHDAIPDAVREYFRTGYPDMRTLPHNCSIAAAAGYEVLSTYTLPRESWVHGYYEVLGPRARALLNHDDAAVRELAGETLREIEIFEASGDSYGYVFYALRRNP